MDVTIRLDIICHPITFGFPYISFGDGFIMPLFTVTGHNSVSQDCVFFKHLHIIQCLFQVD